MADEVFIPFTIGGGIRSVADAQGVLDAGADKVSINSAAVARPELISELADIFGAQCVVLAIDSKERFRRPVAEDVDRSGFRRPVTEDVDRSGFRRPVTEDVDRSATLREWEVFVAGGRTPTGRDALAWAREGVERGAGEILLTSMDRDGTTDGYDLALTSAMAEAVGVPVIASGGAGRLEHLADALRAGADAALAASIFHYGTYSIREAKEHLASAGIAVRR